MILICRDVFVYYFCCNVTLFVKNARLFEKSIYILTRVSLTRVSVPCLKSQLNN